MAELGRSGFGEFDRLQLLVRRTRELLHALLGEGELPRGGADYLADATLPHLERVEAGLRGWVRADSAELAELQYLILQTGGLRVEPARSQAEQQAALAEALAEHAVPGTARSLVHEADPWALLSLAHARLALALMPRLPDGDVRYPSGRRTYADIPSPRGPAELVERIEEVERQLWRTATGRRVAPTDPAFRRTYGFFDAAERLGLAGLGASG